MKLDIKKNNKYGNKPNGILAGIFCLILRIGLRLRYNLRIDKSSIKGLKAPFIVLGNHPSYLDPFIMGSVLYPHRINFLSTNFYFRKPKFHWLLEAVGAIPKIQSYADRRALRLMKQVILRGGAIGLFPEGRRSINGSTNSIACSIAKFIKLYKLPVVSVISNGAYLTWPRWDSKGRPGRIDTTAKIILTPDEIDKMKLSDIYDLICKTLTYNDYEWNKKAQVKYKGRGASGEIQSILHECPRCGNELSMGKDKNRLYCRICGNAAIMNDYGFLEPENSSCVVFEDPFKWYEWQQERMLSRISEDGFYIKTKIKELKIADAFVGPFHSAGSGEIILNRDGLTYIGLVDGEHKDVFFPITSLSSLSADFGIDFEVCDGKKTWWFFLEEGQQVVRIELAAYFFNQRYRILKKNRLQYNHTA